MPVLIWRSQPRFWATKPHSKTINRSELRSVILGSFFYANAWEQRKAVDIFKATADKGHPELPVLSATQDRGMIRREETGINIAHDKKNEATYKRVLPGQFVIHLRSFQGGFAHSNTEGITSPAYTVLDFVEKERHCDWFWKYIFNSESFVRRLETVTYGIRDGRSISYDDFSEMSFLYPSFIEQKKIGEAFVIFDALITLHQRAPCKTKIYIMQGVLLC